MWQKTPWRKNSQNLEKLIVWTKYQICVINSCWEKCDKKCTYMFNVYKNQLNWQTGSRNLTGPKTLPTIWHTYMKLVTKYQICVINRYPMSWEAFLNPSDSYFLFADFVDFYTHWTYMLIFLSNYWWQISDIWSQARVQKRYPQYGIPIWSLGPNIRFLPLIVTEKNILDGQR
jgi:hypothetical protein